MVLLLKYMFRYFTEKQGRDVLNLRRVLTLYFFTLLCFQLSSLLSLSPEQLVGLMFDDVPGLPEKSVIINAVFDHLIAYPQEVRIKSTLHFLVELSKTVKGFFGTLLHLFLMSVQSLTSGLVSFRGTSPVRRIRSCECVVTCCVCFMCWISGSHAHTSVCMFASFHRLDHLMVSVSVNLETVILRSKSALLQQVPPGKTQLQLF